jgi:hypothetical protein
MKENERKKHQIRRKKTLKEYGLEENYISTKKAKKEKTNEENAELNKDKPIKERMKRNKPPATVMQPIASVPTNIKPGGKKRGRKPGWNLINK